MFLLQWFIFAISFNLVFALAPVNLTAATLALPACSLRCSAELLPSANCELTDIQNCLCTNITLQKAVFVCVQAQCNYTEQLISTTVAQEQLCAGVPQPSRTVEIIRIVIIVSTITFPLMALRVYSRFTLATLWWDDWVIVFSFLCLIPMTAIPIVNATKGFGNHVWDVQAQNIQLLGITYYISQIFYVITQSTAKASILLLYLRIFPVDRFRLWTRIFLVWTACHGLAFLFAVSFQCIPVDALWNYSKVGRCVNSVPMIFAGAALSITEDLMIVLLPIPLLQSLKLSLKKRLMLIFMFALGSFACITSMVRLRFIIAYNVNPVDVTWDHIDIVIWSILEIYTAMICASLMALRPLLVKWFPGLFPTTRTYSDTYVSGSNPSWRPRVSQKYSGKIWSASATGNSNGVELESTEKLQHVETGTELEGIKKTTKFEMEIEEGNDGHGHGHGAGTESVSSSRMEGSTVRDLERCVSGEH